MEIGFESEKNLGHIRLVEKGDVINEGERGDNLCPFLLVEDWPPFSLKLADRGIAVQSHNQDVSSFLGFLQVSDMSDMNQIKTAVSQDDSPSSFFMGADDFF